MAGLFKRDVILVGANIMNITTPVYENSKFKRRKPLLVCPKSESHKKIGLTLIEMSVIVSLIIIIASIGIPEYFNFRERAARSNALSSAREFGNAVVMYRVENSAYPPAGSIIPLAKYVDLTRYLGAFDMTKTITTQNGVEIYDPVANTKCIYAIVKEITPEYRVSYCPETSGSATNTQYTSLQPTCSWDGGTTWYPCSTKM